mgnify:CR=1 FL=1
MCSSDLCAGFYDRYYILFLPSGDSLAYDIYNKCWVPIKGWGVSCCYTFEDNTLHAGWASGGWVKQLFTGKHDDGDEIECEWASKYLGAPGVVNCIDKIRVNANPGHDFTVSWRSDVGEGTAGSITFTVSKVGTYLAVSEDDEDGFMLGDDNIPDSGDWLVSDEDIGSASEEHGGRLQGGQTFKEIQFTIHENSTESFELDYVEIDYYPVRRW